MQFNQHEYGVSDGSYRAAGGIEGITHLVDTFYSNMDVLPEAKKIRAMHSENLTESRKKLAYFLSGWLGGPRLYSEHYGSINIPGFHQHFSIGETERDAWLLCMQKAIDEQPYENSFKEYLLTQLKIPAARVQERSIRQV